MIVFNPQKDLLRETVTSNKVLEKTIQMAMEAKTCNLLDKIGQK